MNVATLKEHPIWWKCKAHHPWCFSSQHWRAKT